MTTFFDVFISYGRADSKAFATKLHQRLTALGLKVWFDQNDIPPAVDWQQQIDDGIERTHNFIFIIAPHAVNSVYCLKEIELALKYNKRIIPLVHIKSDKDKIHPVIRKLNWIYFQEDIDDFEASFAQLINALNHQIDYVKQHTQFLIKALEWERHQKRTSYLLIGEEKQQAQSWLQRRFKYEQPPCVPNDLHCEYITESIKNANNLMTQVIISYAEADRTTMDKIRNSLRRESITVWTNATDIQTGEAFEVAIKRGIEQADNLVYLLSPDVVNSSYCQQELNYALSLNKRIIPVLVRETPAEQIPHALRDLQYIDLTDNVKEEDYLLDESQLLKILRRDEAYYNEHKVLLTKALKWKQQHENPSILLRGYNLRSAQAWLKVANKRTQHVPTPLIEEYITNSLRQPPLEFLDVFISYSRADSDLARKLNEELELQGKTTWFDQESIASGSDFQQEIYRGIQACDNFLFILSPRSVNSPYCKDEVEYAAGLNKRFVTVLHRQVNRQDLHPALDKVQRIDFEQNERDFNDNFKELVRTLDTDREHLRHHTKWLHRAIAWQEKDRNEDLLLRGSEFAIAQNWLEETEQQQKQPAATPLQKALIEKSENAIVAAQEAEKRRRAEMLRLQEERTQEAEARLALQKKSARRQAFFLSAVSIALAVASVLGIAAFFQYQKATVSEIKALSKSSEALSISEQKFDALIEALKAGTKLRRNSWTQTEPELQAQVITVLQQATNSVRERNRLVGHTFHINTVVWSPDGQTLATASADQTVKIWNREGKLLQTLRGHKDQVWSVSFSPDGKTIATASFDKTIKLWNREGKLLQTLRGHKDQVWSVSFSPDGKTIVSGSADKTAILWNLEGEKLQTLTGHTAEVKSVFSPDGKTIATSSFDKTIKLWNLEGKELKTLHGHQNAVWSVSFSPDGQTLVSGSADNTVKLWNLQGEEIQTLEGHNAGVTSVSFRPDGQLIASSSADQTVKLWSREGKELQTLTGHTNWVQSVSFSPDSQLLASASNDNTVKLWSLEHPYIKKLTGHNDVVTSISFSPDNQLIATASASLDKTVKLWNLQGKELQILTGHDGTVWNVTFSPDSKTIATASFDKTVKLWNLQGKELQTLKGHTGWVRSVSFSPDGQTIATASDDTTVKLWNLQGEELRTLRGHNSWVMDVAFSPDGKTIATASNDKIAKLWNLKGEELQMFKGHDGGVNSVNFSPNGKTILTTSYDKTAKLWNLEGKELQAFMGHNLWVLNASFSPDGKTIATASKDKTIKLWNLEGEELKTLKEHNQRVNSVSFTPDGKILASASNDRTVILWNSYRSNLDELLVNGCEWVGDYLKNNPNVEKSDRTLCDGIETQK